MYTRPMKVFRDGSAWCATYQDFVNLQESIAGFGDSVREAITELLKQGKMLCGQAMWYGDGRPCWCRDPCLADAYGEPRCEHHGGPTLEEAVILEMGLIP